MDKEEFYNTKAEVMGPQVKKLKLFMAFQVTITDIYVFYIYICIINH